MCENLTSFYYDCENPIESDSELVFDGSLENATLYVPATAVEKCKVTAPWKHCQNIEAYDFSGVDSVSGAPAKTVTRR